MQTVLVVDDNAAVRMVISDFLAYTFEQVKVLQAVDGLQGMTLIKEQQPDLILLDAEMPNMNGYQVAQELRSTMATRQIPIIAISSGAENNPVVAGLRAISDASLPKPFSPDELLQAVNKVCFTRYVTG